jgi:hypothetical protein
MRGCDPHQHAEVRTGGRHLPEALPWPVQSWSLTMLRKRLIKIGAKVVRHAKALTFPMAGVEVPRALFAAILGRIGRLRAKPSPG